MALMLAPSAQASWLRKKGHQPQVNCGSPEKSSSLSGFGQDWRPSRIREVPVPSIAKQLLGLCGNRYSCGSGILPQIAHVQATEGWFAPAASSLQSARHTVSSAAREADRKVVKPFVHQAQSTAAETQRWFKGMVGRRLPPSFISCHIRSMHAVHPGGLTDSSFALKGSRGIPEMQTNWALESRTHSGSLIQAVITESSVNRWRTFLLLLCVLVFAGGQQQRHRPNQRECDN